MHSRLRLLLLAACVAGIAAVFSGAAAAQAPTEPPRVRESPTIIIRPVVEPAVEQAVPAPVLSSQPQVSDEWVVTDTGRFQNLTAAPADPATVQWLQERHEVDAIFPVAPRADQGTPVVDRSEPRREPVAKLARDDARTARAQKPAALRSDAAPNRPAAKPAAQRPATTVRPAAKRPAAKGATAKASRTKRAAPAKAKAKANAKAGVERTATATPRKEARDTVASARRTAQIRTATARVKRALRVAAAHRRRAIPAPEIVDVPVTTVRGITVHRRIADRTEALLAAADRANLRLNGWGYRSTRRQIQLRREHCGASRYALYRMPAGRCWPPTAQPGKSMHERGLAIDFYVEGRKGRALPIAGTREFRWLQRHAARYGFYNLPSEAWHWSTNGR